MTHLPPPAEELRLLDTELRQLDARRALLLARRAWLITALRPPVAPPLPLPPVRRPETTAPRVQNVLLVLGGTLLTVAAIAFTLVSWGRMGIAGRALVLGAVTLAALGSPVLLLRHRLRSTAEAVAGLGLALTVLDVYALHEVAFPDTNGLGYAAVASALLAALWTAYGLALGGPRRPAGEPATPARLPLRLPLPTAMAAAQLPLILWAAAADAGAPAMTAALLVTAALDTAVALRVPVRSVCLVAAVGAYGLGGWGSFAAGWLSWTATGPSAVARAAALLLFAAAIALAAAWRLPDTNVATWVASAGGLLTVAALGGVPRSSLPGEWTVPGYLVCAVALLAAVRTGLPEPMRRGLALAAASVQAVAVVWALPPVAVALLGPVTWVGRVWAGAPSTAREAVTTDGVPWPPYAATAPLVLVVVAAVAAVLAVAVRGTQWRPRAAIGASALVWAAALVFPAALDIPYWAGMSAPGLTIVAALAYVARSAEPRPVLLLALVSSVSLACLSLATEGTTLGVLAALTVLFAAVSGRSRLAPVAALTYATALACAVGASLGWPSQYIALLVLLVPVVAALLAARLAESPARVPLEVTGAVAGLLAVGLAVPDPPMLALVLALCAVIAAGTAVREDRRPAGYAATALFVLAAWVRLACWGVGSVEAYTLPVTVPALLVGAVRRRKDPLTSSWTAYGAGLSVTLVPSLLTAWIDPDWPRPLLLGVVALAVTLVGARHRLRAPLVLGGGVLALDALHELAPHLVQMAGALPRWVPPALAGLVLLALGATYEQRIRDARRVRDVLGRMR